ncbi:hypothetical protein [Desulfovibrio inopinatus]|uniref:hypothetical protein n=1 Tax=Desulfovibrio inopinatus TaxID=102109 RepID=UPI000409F149|nr:hypothetical protein [Desulfovibrio inopinatus]
MNHNDCTEPIELVLHWFYGLPPGHREQLARTYWAVAGDDVNDMFLPGERAVDKFEADLLQPDFPIRKMARLFQVRAMIDFIFDYANNPEAFSLAEAFSFETHVGRADAVVISFNDKQWERDIRNWRTLWANQLSSDVLDAWLREMTVNEGL